MNLADQDMKRTLSIMAIILVALLLLATVPINGSRYQDLLNLFMDFLHFPSAVFLTIFSVMFFQFRFHTSNMYPALAVSSLLLVLIELFQPFVGRTSDTGDLILGLLGVLFGAIWILQLSHRRALYGVVKFLLLLLFFLYSLVQVYIASLFFHTTPEGFDFEQPFALSQWRNLNHIQSPKLSIERNVQQEGGRLVMGKPIDYQWSGMTFFNNLGIDLSHKDAMLLDYFHNGDQQTKIRLRLDDSKRNTFKADTQYVRHGWNQVVFELPFNKHGDFNADAVIKIGLFTDTEAVENFYLVDNIYFRPTQ